MDYLRRGSSTGMAAITGSGRFPAPSNGMVARTFRESCATSRPASRSTHRNSITWASASRSAARRWPMPTKGATLAYPCGVGRQRPSPRRGRLRRRRTGVGPGVYALVDDHRSVQLSVWAHFRSHQGGGEDAHAARPAGQHSEFYPHLGWQAARRSCPRYALAGSRSHLRRGSWLRRLCPPLCGHQAGAFSVTRAKSNIDAHASFRLDRSTGHLRPDHLPGRLLHPSGLPRIAAHPLQGSPSPARRWSSSPTTSRFRPPPSCALQKPLAGGSSSSSGSSSIFGSSSSWHVGERGEDADLDCRLGLRPGHRQEAPTTCDACALHFVTNPLGDPFEKMPIHQALAGDENRCNASQITNQLNLLDF